MGAPEPTYISAKTNSFFRWVSIGFHPLLVPTYGFLLLFTTDIVVLPCSEKITSAALCFLFTFLLPATIALILLKKGKLKSLEMESTTERIIPYAGAFICNSVLCWLYNTFQFPMLFSAIIVASTVAIFVVWCINFYWKISAHGVGIGGLIGAFLAIQQNLHVELHAMLLTLTLSAMLIGYARLQLKAHNTLQVVAGFMLGLLIEFLTVLYY